MLSSIKPIARQMVDGGRQHVHWLKHQAKAKGRGTVMMLPSSSYPGFEMRDTGIAAAMEAQGWSVPVISPTLSLAARRYFMALYKPDILILRKVRHPLQRAMYYPDTPYILDMDDADHGDDALRDDIIDVARHAATVVCGSHGLADWYKQYSDHVEVVWTGYEVDDAPTKPHTEREPVVGWGHGHPAGYPKEAAFFADVMEKVMARAPQARMRLYGWQGDHPALIEMAENISARGIAFETRPFMSHAEFRTSLEELAVGVQIIHPDVPFSHGKSFGKILNYLDAKVPVVATDAVDHPKFFDHGQDGLVLPHDPDLWAKTIVDLLNAPDRRQNMADAGKLKMRQHLSLDVAAEQMGKHCEAAIARARLPGR
ncbi:MAG: glycosyltransferase [Pseudomonadota bacterium]